MTKTTAVRTASGHVINVQHEGASEREIKVKAYTYAYGNEEKETDDPTFPLDDYVTIITATTTIR